MSATTAPATYMSGHCDVGAHDRCRATYAGARCACPCHDEPPPPPQTLRIGSLFSGYEGLGMATQHVLGGDIAWVSDIDPGACKILAHRYPTTPNIGDITAVDWAAVPLVDVLTGGFPCQDVSAAGLRKGMRPDTRSGLWTHFAYAIDQLRPRMVVIENVRGLLSADAHHPSHDDLEPCPWCMGDGEERPLRALGAVLGQLADLGYDASWQGLRASDVGAPHGRFRVFVIAWPADSNSIGRDGWPRLLRTPGWGQPADRRAAVAPYADGDGREVGRTRGRGAEVAAASSSEEPAADADGDGLTFVGREHSVERDADGRGGAVAAWGPYEPAVRRWERVTRPAPAPTEQGRTGPRLSPRFVEWLMGLPAGWVTDVPGLTRNEQLKALGNGVVPQQAAEVLRLLLPDVAPTAA
jgi:DNA (cytosine-5)-methyltransferase 1